MKISIVIPCRNEVQYISKCIESISSFSSSQSIEVFVVDGMSDDGTRLVLAELVKKYSWLHVLDNPKRTTPIALNTGIKNSTGDYVMILGAHSELKPDFFEVVLPLFQLDTSIGCAGALLQNISEDLKTQSIAAAMSSPFGMGSAHFRTGLKEGFVDTVAFGIYKKEVFETAGLFDEELTRNQDDEFNYRVLKGGYKIYLTNKTSITYYVRSTFGRLYRQFFQYGYWKVYVNKKHKSITTLRQLIPFLFVGFLIGGFISHLFFQILVLPYIIGIALYLTVSFLFSIRNALSGIFGVWYSFLIIHLSYGIGYWKGVIEFLILNKKPSSSKSGNKLTR